MPDSEDKQTRTPIQPATSTITLANRWDHVLARLGIRRSDHRVEPGLYALGRPTAESPVFVTANYTLSFDGLRSALAGTDGYILVLDTQGVNVWCAAGKGTFGTDELTHRIEVTGLRDVVLHHTLILPQLGATGVAAHEVRKRTGFKVEYGPVRAQDLPLYLTSHAATPEIRRVRFTLRDRLVLVPIELVHILLPLLLVAAVTYFAWGWLTSIAVAASVLAGVVLFPILLPWLPTRDFSSKGFILGGIVMLGFALAAFACGTGSVWWLRVGIPLTYLLSLTPVTAYLALNFTGSTTFTNKSGVRREIFTYVPIMAWTFGVGIVLAIGLSLIRVIGG